MKMRFRYFSWTLLLVLCAFAFGSGSQLVAPQLKFTKWKAGLWSVY